MKIVIPAEQLAAAVNKYLMPAAIRKLAQEQSELKEDTAFEQTEIKQLHEPTKNAI